MKAIASVFSNCKPREFLANFFKQTNEPKIIARKNNRGNIYFKVYDPRTKYTANFSSEQEVRIWLDKRYYSRF